MLRIGGEIAKSKGMEHFLARPRFALGVAIIFAGTTLLLTDALKVIYR
jgi:hypothetical protein